MFYYCIFSFLRIYWIRFECFYKLEISRVMRLISGKDWLLRMTFYKRSILTLFICALVLAPTTVYAQEESTPAAAATVQPLSGAAIACDNLPTSLVESIYTYLVDSFTMGIIGVDEYNQILNSELVSENAFFAHSVFVGDSLTVGFEKYCQSHSDSILTDTTYFLARVSCSARAAVSENALTKHAKIMPLYNGTVQYFEDAIAQMADVNKVFICLGINDLTGGSPDRLVADIQTLVLRILEKRPDVKIYIISVPCVMPDVSVGALNNTNIQISNILLQNTCQIMGLGFINLSEYLMDESNALRAEYSSDNYVHQNSRAYEIWNRVLKNYAFSEIIR